MRLVGSSDAVVALRKSVLSCDWSPGLAEVSGMLRLAV